MRIIIAGCGNVGSAILDRLSHSGHDIIALDVNADHVAELNSNYDVMAIVGRCTDCDLLREIDAGEADIFIATSNSDEVNALGCLIAKKLGAGRVIARIADTIYSEDTLRFIKNQLGIDIILNPPKLVGNELCKQLLDMRVRRVFIVGGGRTGAFTGMYLAKAGIDVVIVEKDEERCEYLADLLPESVTIIHGDGGDHLLLSDEGLLQSDAFISVTDIEEENILLAVYAKSCKVPHTAARIRQREFIDIGLSLGIDEMISVIDITADLIDLYVEKVAQNEL